MTSPNFTPIDTVKKNFGLYREALRANGYDPARFVCPMAQQIYVGANEEAGYREPEEACMSYFHKLASLLPKDVQDGKVAGDDFASHRRTQARLSSPDLRYDYLYETSVCYGSAARVTERIQMLRDQVDVDHIVGWFNFGNLDHELAKDSMRRFADEVMPRFTAAVSADPAMVG